ncbi:MAG TPA: hypothetical protein VFR33_07785 [Candidatus Dormibacteraeota bacterium]|nr:hypothetical protein [Candidatus Dormibacteraeota bacterium]
MTATRPSTVRAPGPVKMHPFARATLFVVRRPGLAVAVVASALAMIVTQPVIAHMGDTIYGIPGDATGGVTQYWWWGYALTHGKSIFDNTLEGVPLGSEWSQIPFVVLPLLIFPFLSIAIGPIASYNLLVLSAFPLTAWATFLLARRLGWTALASAFSGLAFAFVPYHVEKAMGHANATHMEFVALTFFFLVRWRQHQRWRDAALAGAMLGLQLWMDYSFTLVLTFGVLAFFVVSVALVEKGLSRVVWLRSNIAAGLVMAIVFVMFVPLMLVTAHRPGTSGSYTASLGSQLGTVQRSFAEIEIYSARPLEFVEPWSANPLVPARLRAWELQHLHGSNTAESTLFLGYTVIVLGLIALAIGRRPLPTALALGLMAMGAVMAAPPTFHVLGIELHGPSYFLFQVINFFREYARFSILTMLGAALLAAGGFTALQARLGSGRRQLLMLLPFLLLAVEFNNMPPNHVTQILPAPAEYTWLRDQPPGVLMEYPAHSGSDITQEVQDRQYMLYQMVHLHPTFLNESPTKGIVASAAEQLEPYYGPGVAGRLKSYGVKYVFVHRDDYMRDGWQLPTVVEGLTYVTTINGVDVYTVG